MAQRACSFTGCTKPHRAKGLCSTHYNQTRYTTDQRHQREPRPCTMCGRVVSRLRTSRYPTTACSTECRRLLEFGVTGHSDYDWASDAMARAKQAGARHIERVERETVFARDSWTCYRCDTTVTTDDPFARTAATIDHVTPLSRGGDHTYSNTATCCLSCNSSKGAQAA